MKTLGKYSTYQPAIDRVGYGAKKGLFIGAAEGIGAFDAVLHWSVR